MSTTATSFDAKTSVSTWIRQIAMMYCKDLDAITNEQFTTSFAGKARTPQSYTAEVIGFNFMVAKILSGESPSMPSDEEQIAFQNSVATTEIAKSMMTESAEAMASALEALTPEQLGEEVQTPWGMPITKFGFANLTAGHMWYHDGQLNYVQSLNGDDAIHWM